MSGSHGDLFHEIGKLVLAAHAGQSIDLAAKSEELAMRYRNLGMPAELIAKAIARSLGAIGISMAIVADGGRGANGREANGVNGHALDGENGHAANGANGHEHANGNAPSPVNGGEPASANGDEEEGELAEPLPSEARAKAAALFPSGLRLSVLS